jgi:hypothetical protein
VNLKVAPAGGSVKVSGEITTAAAPFPGAILGLPVVMQLLADDSCWSATFTAAQKNDGEKFNARGGS